MESQVIVLYRDIRTYGFMEDAYSEAREKGVNFVPYEQETAVPASRQEGGRVGSIRRPDSPGRGEPPPRPGGLERRHRAEDIEELSKILKMPVTGDRFYLEAHVKLRPVEISVDGIYLCGLAHAPKPMAESIVQAQAAACKAGIPLAGERWR